MVVIILCDPYTELGYFQTIDKMVECVEQNVADLVLIGIVHTYASEKYGYVIPVHENTSTSSVQAENENFKMVSRFTEKTSVEIAESFLRQETYWNGGVFAFNLAYMMNIVKKHISLVDFVTVKSKYSEFPKISFDCEVAEKAESVAAFPFSGEWKDHGTWNTLTDEFKQHVISNAEMGAHCDSPMSTTNSSIQSS